MLWCMLVKSQAIISFLSNLFWTFFVPIDASNEWAGPKLNVPSKGLNLNQLKDKYKTNLRKSLTIFFFFP